MTDELRQEMIRALGKPLYDAFVSAIPLDELLSGPGPEELIEKFGKDRLVEKLKPEDRLAGLEPAELMAGLKLEDRLAGFSVEELEIHLEKLKKMKNDALEFGENMKFKGRTDSGKNHPKYPK